MSLHLILGGARSGKSARAQQLAIESGLPVVLVATCLTHWMDEEMRQRVLRHKQDRPMGWTVIEDRLDLVAIFKEHRGACVVVDCLTLWLSAREEQGAEEGLIFAELKIALENAPERCVVVSNELGWGLVPETVLGRKFRDMQGRGNQQVATFADGVEMMVAGIPLRLK